MPLVLFRTSCIKLVLRYNFMSLEMIEEVYNEWSKETGRRPTDMTPKEFADRMMIKVKASAIDDDWHGNPLLIQSDRVASSRNSANSCRVNVASA